MNGRPKSSAERKVKVRGSEGLSGETARNSVSTVMAVISRVRMRIMKKEKRGSTRLLVY